MNKLVALIAAVAFAGGTVLFGAQSRAAQPQVVTFRVLIDQQGLLGSDGRHHDAIIPANIVVKAGMPVTFRFINYDDTQHTMTAPKLGINFVIHPGQDTKAGPVIPAVSSYTFTPAKSGQFRWYCLGPCNPWSMAASFDGPDRDGYMAGYIVVMN